MATQHELDLVRQFAPIFWMHEREAFFPEDCAIMASRARVGSKSMPLQSFQLDDLANIKKSKDAHMVIDEVDYEGLGTQSAFDSAEIGPDCLSDHFRERFSNNPILTPMAREPIPQFYARVTPVRIDYNPDDLYSRFIKEKDPLVFGDYEVVQYYFFYLFNDAWNKHIGDWDSSLEIYLKKDGTRKYAVYHMHHCTWMADFNRATTDLNNWLQGWRESEEKKMGQVFHINGHPFVFVAKGAHGGYPTPGFSVHGIKVLWKFKMIGQTDCRQIGKICIYPHPDVSPELIRQLLDKAQIIDQPVFLTWQPPIYLENQPWLKFKGYWGVKSEYEGWSGPKGPAQQSWWTPDPIIFKNNFREASEGRYLGGTFLAILRNWHGWKPC